jgi:protein-ribulosamine 3-kinase
METFAAIAAEIAAQSGVRAHAPRLNAGRGGPAGCHRLESDAGALFVKVGEAQLAEAFAAEAAGLTELAAAGALRVPRALASGRAGTTAFLALEWIEAGRADRDCERRLGEGLAALHAVHAGRFGWKSDNSIGRSPQLNGWCDEWAQFFAERRLRAQLELAHRNGIFGALGAAAERLPESAQALLAGHRPAASLLHGDLWGGNWLATTTGEPVIFDPAVYYGDRETDLAMTRLFGGFGAEFYRAYESAAPLTPGAPLRAEFYNLYHVLNHANLFGGGYVRQARATIARLTAQLR